jgi:putative two-component system response regulator
MIDTPLRGSRILVVDDEPADATHLVNTLADAGYPLVDGVTEPERALTLHADRAYDLLIVDLHMPRLDGFGLLEAWGLHRDDAPPAMAVTRRGDRADRLRALELGARDFVAKPLDRPEFLVRVHNLLEARCQYHKLRRRNHELSRRVAEQDHRLEASHLELLRHLGRAAEFRDNETSLHAVRMSEYAYEVAIAAGLGEALARQIRHACPMHDIGKIGVPDHILLKPGRLTSEEFGIIRQHPLIAGEILAGHASPVVQMARVIALTHHERWDGAGYPHGLAGTAIPIVGRVASLCDVFDALTSERPYKAAWRFDDAVAEIARGAGTQFDPAVVRAFLSVLPRIQELMRTYADPPSGELRLPADTKAG